MRGKREKHCATCTCGQIGMRPNSFFIRQQIGSGHKKEENETIESVLKLLGHSFTTIRQAIDSNNGSTPSLTPRSSVVVPKLSKSLQPSPRNSFENKRKEHKLPSRNSLESTREEPEKCDYCKSKSKEVEVQESYLSIRDEIKEFPLVTDSNLHPAHISPTSSGNTTCWKKLFCR